MFFIWNLQRLFVCVVCVCASRWRQFAIVVMHRDLNGSPHLHIITLNKVPTENKSHKQTHCFAEKYTPISSRAAWQSRAMRHRNVYFYIFLQFPNIFVVVGFVICILLLFVLEQCKLKDTNESCKSHWQSKNYYACILQAASMV